MGKHRIYLSKDAIAMTRKRLNENYAKTKRDQRRAIKFFQMTQAVSEITKIDTTKLHETK